MWGFWTFLAEVAECAARWGGCCCLYFVTKHRRRQPQHRGRRQPQRRGQRRGGLNLSFGWHSKYCQARFFFTAFGAPSSLQFQALNIPQWTSLQCLVSSIYNYIFHPILAFVFIWGLWYGLLDSFIIKEFTRMIDHIRCRIIREQILGDFSRITMALTSATSWKVSVVTTFLLQFDLIFFYTWILFYFYVRITTSGLPHILFMLIICWILLISHLRDGENWSS